MAITILDTKTGRIVHQSQPQEYEISEQERTDPHGIGAIQDAIRNERVRLERNRRFWQKKRLLMKKRGDAWAY